MRFGPRGDSVVLAVSTSSARVALPTLPTTNPAVALVARGAHQGVWWIKFGDSSVAATITDAKRYEPGSKEHPLIIPITGSPTHIAILAEGEPGDVLVTSGQELLGEFAPSGTASLIDVTQTSAVVALPTLGSPIGAISLICENPLTEALRVKFGNGSATGSDSTSMRVHPGSAADPVILRPTNSETHLAIYCEGEPGRVILTPGALNAGIGNLSPSQARDFLDLNTTDSPTFAGLTINNSAGETKLNITNSNPSGNQNSGIEIGRTDNVAASAYIDFHSGATSVDYDARIIASNGNGASGGGDLNIAAQTLGLNATNILANGFQVRGLVLLALGTVSNAATLDIVLTTLTAFRGLRLVLSNFVPATDATQLQMRFSTDGGASYIAANYQNVGLWTRPSSGPGRVGTTAAAVGVLSNTGANDAVGNAAGESAHSIIDLLQQTSGSFYPKAMVNTVYTPSGNELISMYQGAIVNTTAQDCDALRILFSSGNISSGSWALYGYF